MAIFICIGYTISNKTKIFKKLNENYGDKTVVAHFVLRFKNFHGKPKKFHHVRKSGLVLKIKFGIHGKKGEVPRPWPRYSAESRVTAATTV
jgi:hypothetical protein